MTPGIFMEALIIVLLIATIAYCAVLSTKLKQLKSNEAALKQTIMELIQATDMAERAIQGLKVSTHNNQTAIRETVEEAKRLNENLADKLNDGDELIRKISAVAASVKIGAAPIDRRSTQRPGQQQAPVQSNPRNLSEKAAAATARINALRRGEV